MVFQGGIFVIVVRRLSPHSEHASLDFLPVDELSPTHPDKKHLVAGADVEFQQLPRIRAEGRVLIDDVEKIHRVLAPSEDVAMDSLGMIAALCVLAAAGRLYGAGLEVKGLEGIGGGDEGEVGGVGKREDLKQTEVKIIRG